MSAVRSRLFGLPATLVTIFRTFGVRGLWLRSVHELRRRLGIFRLRPRNFVHELGSPLACFAVPLDRLRNSTDPHLARLRAKRVIGGEYQAYRWQWRALPKTNEEWSKHPLTGHHLKVNAPWWAIDVNVPGIDIKDVWEPARFGWAFDLIRGYAVTEEPSYARTFAEHFSRWYDSSPPFQGPHWTCGQETSIRAIALLYAEANFNEKSLLTQEEKLNLQSVLAASGERIADSIGYAISQRNNHALSEAFGLMAIGIRFEGLHPKAAEWVAAGSSVFERTVKEQFESDGWYIQHSFNYLRLALDLCILAQHLLESQGLSLKDSTIERVEAALRLILRVISPANGEMPNHGANDGSFIHPVTVAGYTDFRPLVTGLCSQFGWAMPRDLNPDREVIAWLGQDVEIGPPLKQGASAGPSGWAAARVSDTQVFLRGGRYKSRPGHFDPLHIVVRFGGQELVVDPGTYAYNRPGRWRNALAVAEVHNGPIVNGYSSGRRGPRFLWYEWPAPVRLNARGSETSAELVAEIQGSVRRTVSVYPDEVKVVDEILSDKAQFVTVNWLLHPDANTELATIHDPHELRIGSEESVFGWYSQNYGNRVPSPMLSVSRSVAPGMRLLAEFRRENGTSS